MGAETYVQHASGASVQDAFSKAVEDAQYEHGHGGYSGTLAEKHSFTEFTLPDGLSEREMLDACWGPGKDRKHETFLTKVYEGIDNKWGPSGAAEVPCVEDCQHEPSLKHFVFFGWASS